MKHKIAEILHDRFVVCCETCEFEKLTCQNQCIECQDFKNWELSEKYGLKIADEILKRLKVVRKEKLAKKLEPWQITREYSS